MCGSILIIYHVVQADEIWPEVVDVDAAHCAFNTAGDNPNAVPTERMVDLGFSACPMISVLETKGGAPLEVAVYLALEPFRTSLRMALALANVEDGPSKSVCYAV